MPWHVGHNVQGCSGYAVIKDDDGKIVGCHPSREAANRQLAALHASEAEKVWDGAFVKRRKEKHGKKKGEEE